MLFVTGLALFVQFLQICLFKCDFHAAKIDIILKNSQKIEFYFSHIFFFQDNILYFCNQIKLSH